MIRLAIVALFLIAFVLFWNFISSSNTRIMNKVSKISIPDSIKQNGENMDEKIVKSYEQWKSELTEEEFRILREKGTERAFTGKYWDHFETGIYTCAGCGTELFESDTKFDAGCGWPSYFQPLDKSRIIYKEDKSAGMVRTEVMCAKCGGHLGHVFDDGPEPTGLRYCINSGSMNFIKK